MFPQSWASITSNLMSHHGFWPGCSLGLYVQGNRLGAYLLLLERLHAGAQQGCGPRQPMAAVLPQLLGRDVQLLRLALAQAGPAQADMRRQAGAHGQAVLCRPAPGHPMSTAAQADTSMGMARGRPGRQTLAGDTISSAEVCTIDLHSRVTLCTTASLCTGALS